MMRAAAPGVSPLVGWSSGAVGRVGRVGRVVEWVEWSSGYKKKPPTLAGRRLRLSVSRLPGA